MTAHGTRFAKWFKQCSVAPAMVAFFKYEGTGNDFVVVEMTAQPEIVPAICDRRTGVGADGVLFLSHIDKTNASARMTVINRDGSRPEMCGNGVRCVARHLVEQHQFPSTLNVVSDAGPRGCVYSEGHVTVEMGAARVDDAIEISFEDATYHLIPVDVGNPHAVAFVNSHDGVVALGRFLNDDRSAFPNGVNLEFVIAETDRLNVIVFERGVGLTQACGTGACAVAAAAWKNGVSELARTTVGLPGGDLVIEPRENEILMTGPVNAAFSGTFSKDFITRFAMEAS